MQEIILGVFTEKYHEMAGKNGWKKYPFFGNLGYDVEGDILMTVHRAAIVSDRVNFILNGVHFPLSDRSITCQELKHILMNETLLEKTRFWYGGKEVDKSIIEYLVGTEAKGEAGKLIKQTKLTEEAL